MNPWPTPRQGCCSIRIPPPPTGQPAESAPGASSVFFRRWRTCHWFDPLWPGSVCPGRPGAPGDEVVGPHQHAAVFLDFALEVPVRIDVERITAREADRHNGDGDAVGGLDRGSSLFPTVAADAGQEREAALPGEIERGLALTLMLHPDVGQVRAGQVVV